MTSYSNMGKFPCVLVIAATLILAGVKLTGNRSATFAEQDQTAPSPAWMLEDVAGGAVSSERFRGKVVILDFGATWCPPYREEIPGEPRRQLPAVAAVDPAWRIGACYSRRPDSSGAPPSVFAIFVLRRFTAGFFAVDRIDWGFTSSRA